ncbi:cupin domain-containing protein [Halomarina oriensis]|uniref:Cupin domain-containing protein n=1 Tax=Halomarina oriensis TaxID=671145 RepID=A0A6B0GKG3_9EURY|nr:cupin domain-containing protein [Halomarina oriensis]MWG35110.1 cupin domain-containing protein [Halomarina oriensis]
MEIATPDDWDLVEAVEGVELGQVVGGEAVSLQYFHIEPGATVPEHSHPHEQTGYVVEGTLTFVVDGEELTVEPGDGYDIPSDEPHAARNDGDETVTGVEVFAPPRRDVPWAK